MTALKPLSIGEIVDRAASVWRSNWRALFQVLLGFQFIQYVLLKALEVFINQTFPALRSTSKALELIKVDPSVWLPRMVPVMVALAVVVLLNLLVSQVAGVALTSFIFPRLTEGTPPTVGQAVSRAFSRLGTTLGMFALTMAWTVVVGAGFVAPGAALIGGALLAAQSGSDGATVLLVLGFVAVLFGLIGLGLWFLIRFVLTSQVLAVEPVSAVGCFKRTNALSSGRIGAGLGGLVKGRLTVLITIVAFILMVIGFVTGLPELLVMGVYGEFASTAGGQAPQALVVPAQLLQVVAGAAVTPLYIVFQVIFYVDMRVRREGLDLELASRGATP